MATGVTFTIDIDVRWTWLCLPLLFGVTVFRLTPGGLYVSFAFFGWRNWHGHAARVLP